MGKNQLEKIGEELREMGHKRRRLAEQIFKETNGEDKQAPISLYKELSDVSDQTIAIINRQKELLDHELQK